MLFSAVNYALHYNFIHKRSLKNYKNSECFFFFIIIFFIIGVISLFFTLDNRATIPIREIFFTVTSLATSSGFTVTDYEVWLISPQLLLLFLFLMGGCSGSTSGGIKVIRIQILAKYIYRELFRLVHPRAVMNININRQRVDEEIVSKTISFLFIHLLITAISVILVSLEMKDFYSAFTGVLASIGNVGPAFGSLGPSETFASAGNFSKIIFSFNMLVGRLEIFTVVTLLIPSFWRSYAKL
jgi:trk system potassium uptake protein TrkH